ncbi:MAG: hypothetical protein LC126_02320, partial [Bryobacterales bacterium]|nr:hypothetical protein [Bryobacterales bacterium]
TGKQARLGAIPAETQSRRIASALSVPHMENRLRTTLTHEYGHVHFHQFMFEVEARPRQK